jgi:hypothetical protein
MLDIKKLYDKIQNNVIDDLKGDIDLHKNYLFYRYDIVDDESCDDNYDETDEYYGFDSISNEEQLQDTCNEDIDILVAFLDEINELDNFIFTDSQIKKSTIYFKIQPQQK